MRSKIISLALVSFFSLASIAYVKDGHALRSSSELVPEAFIAQRQQPVTVPDSDIKPEIVDPARGGGLACPVGYALTAVSATADARTTVTVYRECNGFAAGYAHVWCGAAPTFYDVVKEAPEVTYTCQRIENKWVAVNDIDEEHSYQI